MDEGNHPLRREVDEMLGEGLRETGVLTLVFGFLDKMVQREGLSPWWIVLVLAIGLTSFVAGIMLEWERRS